MHPQSLSLPRLSLGIIFFLAASAPALAKVELTNSKYAALLSGASLGGFIKWSGPALVNGATIHYTATYPQWPDSLKDELHTYINSYEAGINPAGDAPPEPVGDKSVASVSAAAALYTPEAARKMFLVQVAHSLWVELHGHGPRSLVSLLDKSLQENTAPVPQTDGIHILDWMFASNYVFKNDFKTGKMFLDYRYGGSVLPWNPKYCYDFLINVYSDQPLKGPEDSKTWSDPVVNVKMAISTTTKMGPSTAVFKLSEWMRNHLTHIAYLPSIVKTTGTINPLDYLDAVYGYRGQPPVDRIIWPVKSKMKITTGCWGTSGFYMAILRSINVPVVPYYDGHNPDAPVNACSATGGPHSMPIFFLDEVRLHHGDDPYQEPVSLASLPKKENYVGAIEDLFFDDIEWKSKMVNPTLTCESSDPACTLKNQRCFNKLQRMISFAVKHKSLKLMDYLCDAVEGTHPLDNYLKTGDPNTSALTFAEPLLNEQSRKMVINRFNYEVKKIGKGDYQKGCLAVQQEVFDRMPTCPGKDYYSSYLNPQNKPEYGRCVQCAYAELLQDKFPVTLTAADCPGYDIK